VPSDSVICLAYSPDTKILAAGHSKGLTICSPTGAKPLATLPVDGSLFSISFCADGKLLAGSDFSGIRIWDVAKLREIGKLPDPWPSSVAFSPDGKIIASAAQNSGIRIWEPNTGKLIARFGKLKEFKVAFAPNGTKLITAGEAGLRVWQRGTWKLLKTVQGPDAWVGYYRMAIAPQGTAAATVTDHRIHIWDWATGQERLAFAGHDSEVCLVTFSSDGTKVLSVSSDRTTRLWEWASGQQIRRFPSFFLITAVLSRNAHHVTGISRDGDLHVWDVNRGQAGKSSLRFRLTEDNPCALSLDGRLVAVTESDRVRVLDTARGVLLAEFKTAYYITALTFAHDNRTLVASDVQFLYVWKLSPRQECLRIRNPTDIFARRFASAHRIFGPQVRALAISSDGAVLASGGDDGLIHLWDIASGKKLAQLGNHGDNEAPIFRNGIPVRQISALVFAPDDRTLASAGPCEGILLWELATRQVRLRIGENVQPVCLAFSANGRHIASGQASGTILMWQVWSCRQMTKPCPTCSDGALFSRYWQSLACDNPVQAYEAMGDLIAGQSRFIAMLQATLEPSLPDSPNRLYGLISDLDNDRFAVRRKAMQKLQKLGPWVIPTLRQVLKTDVSAEVRYRLERLLKALDNVPPQMALRLLRTIEILEQIGSIKAKTMLNRLAQGPAAMQVTKEARRALGRLRSVRP
jgi:WD40 repeat protein